jgi:hypothetical protein
LEDKLINNSISCYGCVLRMDKDRIPPHPKGFEFETERKMLNRKTRIKMGTTDWERCHTEGTRKLRRRDFRWSGLNAR